MNNRDHLVGRPTSAGGDGGNDDGWADKDEISDVKSEDDDCRIG